MKKIYRVFLAVACLFLMAACGDAPAQSSGDLAQMPEQYAGKSNPLGEEAVGAGQATYASMCASCHGDIGQGDGPSAGSLSPRPTNLAKLQKEQADDFLYWRIATGKQGTAMVAWESVLNAEEIWQVIAYLRTLE